MTPVEALISVKELLSDPNKWSRESQAMSANGRSVEPLSKRAVSWSVVGAVFKITNYDYPAFYLLKEIDEEAGDAIELYEDTHTHDEVISLLGRVVESELSKSTNND